MGGAAGDEDGEAIDMAFSKKKVEERKEWLRNFAPGTFLDNSASQISYSDFINKVGRARGEGEGRGPEEHGEGRRSLTND